MVENGVWLSKHLSAWGGLVAKSSTCLPNGLFQQPFPRVFGLPSLFKPPLPRVWGRLGIFQQPLPRVWGLPSLFKRPLPRVWGCPGIFQQPLPRVWSLPGHGAFQDSSNNPFRGPSKHLSAWGGLVTKSSKCFQNGHSTTRFRE